MENTNEIYACAYKEVITILGYLSDEIWHKIPKEKRDFYFDNMKKDYIFKFDYSKPLNEQKLLNETRAILANLFKKYLATSEEKNIIINKERQEYERIEAEKRKKYNPDDIFKDVNKKTEETKQSNVMLPVEIKEKNIFVKIFDLIKKLLAKVKR